MTPLAGPVLNAAEMRAAELSSGIALDILMERAGAALAEAAWRFGGGTPVLVLCGLGNNGGDGYVAARRLAERGADVRVAALGEPRTDLARAARRRWTGRIEMLDETAPSPVIVDCLFGTGLARPLDRPVRSALARLTQAPHFLIAADLPSGLATDDGGDLGAVQADLTVAFGAAKPAHLLQPSASLCGRVLIADIGLAQIGKAEVLTRPKLVPPGPDDHKYTRGYVLVVGGAMPGAAALAATAAARAGAGYVVLVGEGGDMPNAVIRRARRDLARLLDDDRVGAVMIGPGLGDDPDALALVLASRHPVVLDGDALRSAPRPRSMPTILTPHAGEFARMFGEAQGSKLDRARDAAAINGATIAYKGADTVIASPDGRATLSFPLSPWLASAGTGDVLTGITAAMLARGLGAHEAACAAVWLHDDAARRAGAGLIADDLSTYIALE